MSQNIFLLLRQEIQEVGAKVETLQSSVDNWDFAALTGKIDALQNSTADISTTLADVGTQVKDIVDTLNPPLDPPAPSPPAASSGGRARQRS